jgi:hypothetical protein
LPRHHLTLLCMLNETRQKHKSLCICWLDLANTFGSVHHNLIEFTFWHALICTTCFHQRHHQPVPESLWNHLHTKLANLSNSTPARGISRWPPVLVFNSSCHEHSSWHHCSLSPWPWIPTGLLSTENQHSTICWRHHSHCRRSVQLSITIGYYWNLAVMVWSECQCFQVCLFGH